MKPSEPSALRVILDTQLLLRGAAAKTESLTARIYEAWRAGRFTLLLSEPILAEVEAVLSRPEVLQKLRVSPIEARALVSLLRRRALLITPTTPIRRSRDPADDNFLECAVAGGAGSLGPPGHRLSRRRWLLGPAMTLPIDLDTPRSGKVDYQCSISSSSPHSLPPCQFRQRPLRWIPRRATG